MGGNELGIGLDRLLEMLDRLFRDLYEIQIIELCVSTSIATEPEGAHTYNHSSRKSEWTSHTCEF